MNASFVAGFVYFALVFAAGFVLGGLRISLLEPRLGALGAVLAELPLMLAVSWLACGWTLRRFDVPGAVAARLVMGVTAFALLMAAELALAVFVFGESAGEFLAAVTAPAGAVGLAGQIAFALMPLARRRQRHSAHNHRR